MTPPKKKPDIRIIEHSEKFKSKFKSKPQQIEDSLTQPPEAHHQVIDLSSYKIAERAWEKGKEKENQGD